MKRRDNKSVRNRATVPLHPTFDLTIHRSQLPRQHGAAKDIGSTQQTTRRGNGNAQKEEEDEEGGEERKKELPLERPLERYENCWVPLNVCCI